ncbi:hypothetical protein LS72_008760 [Helicobacter apodemus]|uniref:Uncharacterized protein n=1 Tax=Helicobacter apodemus TaxID=135569 RepID=A0A4U8UCA3_9HELI|nr:hypothetical protein [Helicobacter apodemus]TLE14482.1 hypothetical protein LS72_008760 [Helicobacter apodemus]
MILEIIHKKEKVFLSLNIDQNSEIGFLANKKGIKITCNGLECEIEIKANFNALSNAVCRVRERIYEALENKDVSLVIDLEGVIEDVAEEMKD